MKKKQESTDYKAHQNFLVSDQPVKHAEVIVWFVRIYRKIIHEFLRVVYRQYILQTIQ